MSEPIKSASRLIPISLRRMFSASARPFRQWETIKSGYNYELNGNSTAQGLESPPSKNDLRKFFDARTEGNGIWKWLHYFDIYDRHFERFRGKEVHILEIGIYSGGSLEMWRDYFGPKAHIYGMDIEPDCREYERHGVKIFIGDQEDRKFWKNFRQQVPALDIVVDDGGHSPDQQTVTLEELLPFIRPGGVYMCEDIHGEFNRFASYVHGLGHKLNRGLQDEKLQLEWNADSAKLYCSPFQSAVASIHLYPFVVVVEKNATPIETLVSSKHGTQWQPFNPESKRLR